VLGVGSEIGEAGGDDLERAVRRGFADSVSRSGDRVVARSLSVQPTIRVEPGTPVHVLVTRDLVLTPYDDKTGR
jgi:type IV secretion system protein TrbI